MPFGQLTLGSLGLGVTGSGGGGASSPLATPLTILGSALREWIDFGDQSTIIFNTTKIASITGKKSGITFSQGSGSLQPQWSATARNGKGGVVFTGAEVLNSTLGGATSTQSVFHAGYNGQSGTTEGYCWGIGTITPSQFLGMYGAGAVQDTGSGTTGVSGYYDAVGTFREIGLSVWAGTDRAFLQRGENAFLYVDGVANNPSAPNAFSHAATGAIGGPVADSPSFTGVMQDWVNIIATITDHQVDLLFGWNSWKNGKAGSNLAGGHPYKLRAPLESDI